MNRLRLNDLQRDIFERLDAQLELDGVSVPVYDHVPEDEPMPYCAIAPVTVSVSDASKDDESAVYEAGVDVYTDALGTEQLHELLERVHLILQSAARGLVARSTLLSVAVFEDDFEEGTINRVGEYRRVYQLR